MKRTQPKEFQPMRKAPKGKDCLRCYGSKFYSVLVNGYWFARRCDCGQPKLEFTPKG